MASLRASSLYSSDCRISSSPASTARNVAALIAKHQPMPTAAISTPPIAGPTIRPALNRDELSATAFGSSSRPTSWKVSAWRFGASKTSAAPPRKASTKYGHSSPTPENASTASPAATSSDPLWVTITVRRLSNRSASTPECSPKSMNGA